MQANHPLLWTGPHRGRMFLVVRVVVTRVALPATERKALCALMQPLPEQLLPLLQVAAREMLAAGDALCIGDYDTCAGLGRFIMSSAAELAGGNDISLQKLWTVFAPTCDWDDAGGSQAVANQIFEMLNVIQSPAGT